MAFSNLSRVLLGVLVAATPVVQHLGSFVMPVGTVKWFDAKKGYGFILNESGTDVFVRYSSIQGDGFRSLSDGDKVEFEQLESNKGLQAQNVRRHFERQDSAGNA